MRAVHVVTRLNAGGIARYLEMARGAVDVLVRGQVSPGEAEARWEGPQLVVPGLGRALRPADDIRALKSLLRLLRRLRPDLIHTHASKAGAFGRVAARLLGLPCVHTFHGHVLSGHFPRPLAWAFERIERRLAGWAKITATGPKTARDLEQRLGVPVKILPPGIALPPAAPQARERLRFALGRPQLLALAVGRSAPVKDLRRFVRAARGAGYLPVVAGATQVAGAVGLGHVQAMQDVYAACDVVVGASRQEGTPFSLLEAAWCGRPVVATPVGDVAWVVGPGGIVTQDLEQGLRRLRDGNERARLGRLGAAAVRERFAAARVAPRLRELYESLH